MDESRNANNAWEMSRAGFSLVTHFHGVADHWSTKPPLLIWLMAACLRLGFPPLLAVRLPSIVAAIASVLVVYFFARVVLRDRLAGLFAGLVLLASPLFVGWHTGRTGDYDSLVVFFTLVYSLSFWRYLEVCNHPPARWLVLAGAALALSALTKGVGGMLVLPALVLYALMRGRLRAVLTDGRLWLTLLAVFLFVGCYYWLRERVDAGYLAAVWRNEFTGRYLAVNEDHTGGPFYYVGVLAGKFEPGFLLLPLVTIPLMGARCSRRSITLLCMLAAGVLCAVLSKSQTKIFWYLAPATPFLALGIGIGLSDAMAWLRRRQQVVLARLAYLAVTAMFAVANLGAVYYYQVAVERKLAGGYMGGRYGPFLEQIRQRNLTNDLILLDEGSSEAVLVNETVGQQAGDFAHYNPEADFFANVEGARGMRVKVVVPGPALPANAWVASCDPRSRAWLTGRYQVSVALASGAWCALQQVQQKLGDSAGG